MKLVIHLNNGESLDCDMPARAANMATLAKQISECDMVHSVDAGIDGPNDEVERYENGKCIGFLLDLI